MEFFVHGEDVRRASDATPPPAPVARNLDPAEQDALWQAVRRLVPLLLHRCPVGLVYVLDDGPGLTLVDGGWTLSESRTLLDAALGLAL